MRRGENFWLRLTVASAQCYSVMSVLTIVECRKFRYTCFPKKNTSIKDIYSVSIYAVSSGYVLSKGICPEEFSADCVQNEMSIPTGLQGMCRVNDAYLYCKPCVLRTDVNLGSFPGNGVRTAHLCVLNLCSVVLLARVSFADMLFCMCRLLSKKKFISKSRNCRPISTQVNII